MKNIKDLGIKTKEGFGVKNYQTFPSMEWGDDGGMKADVYLDDVRVGTVFQRGDGGCADFTWDQSAERAAVKQKLFDTLTRLEPLFTNPEYVSVLPHTPEDCSDDEFEMLVNCIVEKRDAIKSCKEFYANGMPYTALVYEGPYVHYLGSRISQKSEFENILKRSIENKKITSFNKYDGIVMIDNNDAINNKII